MRGSGLYETALALVADAKGILAADETVPTVTRRLAAHQIESTADSRRAYREMFFATPGIDEYISGVILQDETIRQADSTGTPMAELLSHQDIIPGIKVDQGVQPLAGSPDEMVTEGLDGLRQRLEEYRRLGARFAKWRAVITIDKTRPSRTCVLVNAHALARYAAICQEQDLVPIVEPEVLMDGLHDIEQCEAVTSAVLHAVFDALFEHKVALEGMLLKPNMVVPGTRGAAQVSSSDVAAATLRCLKRHAPAAVPGTVFLSGGLDPITATRHLNAINQLVLSKPWKLTYSFGRALQDEALRAWQGKKANLDAGQRAFRHRASCASAAAAGRYSGAMEEALAGAKR